MIRKLTLASVVALVGCSGTTAFQDGQLFCAVANASGTLIAAITNAAGVPVIVTGLASDVVASACAAWNASAVPVSPPAAATPVTVPTIAAPTPPAATPGNPA